MARWSIVVRPASATVLVLGQRLFSGGKDLLQDLGHGDRSLHSLIQQKAQFGRVADFDALGDFRLQEAGGALQAAQRKFLVRLVAHHRHVHLGVAQVGRHFDVRHRHVADARISIGQDRHADDFADGFGGFFEAAGRHGGSVGWSWSRGELSLTATATSERSGDLLDLVGLEQSPSLMSLNPASLMPHSKPSRTSRASSFSRFSDSMA